MAVDFKSDLIAEKQRYYVASGGGISLPVAGAIYWIAAGVLGSVIPVQNWGMAIAAMSGLIFPLGLALQGVLKSPFMKAKSALSGVVIAAVLAINLLWPVHIALISLAPVAAGLSLAIGMTLHWPIIGWAYHSRVCLLHAIARVILVSALWYLLPDGRMTILPFAVAGLYLLAAAGMRWEVVRARRKLDA